MSNVFTLLTYNIHKGFSQGHIRFVLPLIKEALEGVQADCLCLQEVMGAHQRFAKRIMAWPKEGQAAYLAERLWPRYCYGRSAHYRGGHHGNAVLSRLTLQPIDNIVLSHLPWMSRGFLHVTLTLPTMKLVHVVCVHMGLSRRKRHEHLNALCEYIALHIPAKAALVVAGDFNDWRQEDTRRLEMEHGLQEVFQLMLGHYAKTFPASRPTWSNDRIYFRGLELILAQCFADDPWKRLSDHIPLLAQFKLPTDDK